MVRSIGLFVGIAIIATLSTVKGQENIACLGVPDGVWVRSSQSCAHWFYCRGQVGFGGVCPQGMHFHAVQQACGYIELVDCNVCSPFGQQNIRAPETCTAFIRCTNGVSEVVECPNGLYFNVQTGQCDAGGICDIITTPPPITTEDPNATTTEDPWATTTEDPWGTTTEDPWGTTTEDPWGTTTDDPWGTTPPGGPNVDCSGAQIHHAHPSDCTKFYLCVNNQATLRQCPSGLHWNQFVNACDLPENANCLVGVTAEVHVAVLDVEAEAVDEHKE